MLLEPAPYTPTPSTDKGHFPGTHRLESNWQD